VQTVGRHLLLELYECDAATLDSVDAIRDAVRAAVEKSGATIVGETYHHFDPQGVSGSVLIAESHVSLHTWPEIGYAAADFYTCGDINPRVGFAHLAATLGAGSHKMVEIVRGLDADVAARTDLPADVHRIADLSK
jgi:S-adenosylmethionine decarboxylase